MEAVNLSLLPLLLGKLLIISPIGKRLTSALTRSMEEGALQRLKTRNALLQFAAHSAVLIAFLLCGFCVACLVSQPEDFTAAYIAVLVIFTLVFFVLTSLQEVIVCSGNGKRK